MSESRASEADRDLRARFHAARREQGPLAPEFSRMWAGAREQAGARGPARAVRAGFLRPALAAAAGVMAFVVAISMAGRGGNEPVRPGAEPMSLANWTAPTDFLLEYPGHEFLSDLPSLGDSEEFVEPGQIMNLNEKENC